MKNLKWFLIIGIVLIIFVTIMFFIANNNSLPNHELDNNQNVDFGEEYENNMEFDFNEIEEINRLDKDIKFNGMLICNIEFKKINSRECELRADIVNETKNVIESQNVKIKTYDEGGNLLDVFGGQIDSIEADGHTEFYALVRRKGVSDISKIEIEENK